MREWWATSDALRDVLVQTGRAAPQRRVFGAPDVQPGWPVLDNELVRIGTVQGWQAGIDESFLKVGRRFRSALYVPASAIGSVHEGSVILNIPREWIASLGWTAPPRRPATGGPGRV